MQNEQENQVGFLKWLPLWHNRQKFLSPEWQKFLGCSYLPLERWGDNHLSNSAQTKKGGEIMLNKVQMKLANHVFSSVKNMLFATGGVPQTYIITRGGDALVFPTPDSLPISSGVSMELIERLCEVEETELVIFVSEIWSVKRESHLLDKNEINDENWQEIAREHLTDGKSPSQQPDKSESLMMLVLEVKTKKIHMRMGEIKRDSKGGAYVEEDEWLPEADIGALRTNAFPSKLH